MKLRHWNVKLLAEDCTARARPRYCSIPIALNHHTIQAHHRSFFFPINKGKRSMQLVWNACLLYARHCAKLFITISFNPETMTTKYVYHYSLIVEETGSKRFAPGHTGHTSFSYFITHDKTGNREEKCDLQRLVVASEISKNERALGVFLLSLFNTFIYLVYAFFSWEGTPVTSSGTPHSIQQNSPLYSLGL